MATKSKTLSFRVTEPFYNEVTTYCKHTNKTVSELLQTGFTDIQHPSLFKEPEPSKEITNTLLTMGGGSLVGVLVYKGVYSTLKKKYPNMKMSHLETYSITSAVASAILACVGIAKLIKSMKS